MCGKSLLVVEDYSGLVLEGVTGFASPGARMMSYLLPPRGLRDFGRSLVLSITLDSAFCFAVLVAHAVFQAVYGEKDIMRHPHLKKITLIGVVALSAVLTLFEEQLAAYAYTRSVCGL
jgi:hypothetical protein